MVLVVNRYNLEPDRETSRGENKGKISHHQLICYQYFKHGLIETISKRNSNGSFGGWQPSVDSTRHLDDVSRSISDQGGVTSLSVLTLILKETFAQPTQIVLSGFNFMIKRFRKISDDCRSVVCC